MRSQQPEEHRCQIETRQKELREVLSGLDLPQCQLVWEVGSGHGHFLTAYARSHPAHTCIGVDIMSDRVARAERKRVRAKLANLHFLRADAADFLAVLPEKAQFTSVFVLFPDPWPKRRHHKNRVLNTAFLTTVAVRSSRGTRLHFRTDYEPYYRAVSTLVRAHPDWIEGDPAEWPFEEKTVFEARAPAHFSLVARRK